VKQYKVKTVHIQTAEQATVINALTVVWQQDKLARHKILKKREIEHYLSYLEKSRHFTVHLNLGRKLKFKESCSKEFHKLTSRIGSSTCRTMMLNPFTAGTHYTGFRAKFGRAPEPSLLEITRLWTAGAQ